MSGRATENTMGMKMNESNTEPVIGRNNIYTSGFNGLLSCPSCSVYGETPDSSIQNVQNGINLPSEKYYDIYLYESESNKYSKRILGSK